MQEEMSEKKFFFGCCATWLKDGIYAVTNIAVTNLSAYPDVYYRERIFLLKVNLTMNSTIWLLQ